MSKPDGKYKISSLKEGKTYYLGSQLYYPTDANNEQVKLMANEKREEGQIWVLAQKCNAYSIEYGDDSYGLKGKKVLVDEEKENSLTLTDQICSGFKLETIDGKDSYYLKELFTGRYLTIDGDEKMKRDKYSMYLSTKEKPETEWILELA